MKKNGFYFEIRKNVVSLRYKSSILTLIEERDSNLGIFFKQFKFSKSG
jgi:hypothetical protein